MNNSHHPARLLGMTVLTCLCFLSQTHARQHTTQWMSALYDSLQRATAHELFTSAQLGMSVYDLTDNTPLFVHHARWRMRPASTLKLITAITALDELGCDHQLSTRLYHTGHVADSTLWGDIYVEGGFDPTTGTAEAEEMAQAIAALGIDSIAGALCADIGMKDTLQWGFGWCWDDDMPPLTPLLYKRKQEFMPRLQQQLTAMGIASTQTIPHRHVPDSATLLHQHLTPMHEVLQRMLKKSDNLYAEAMFYQLAAMDGRPFASRRDANYRIERLISRLGYDPGHYLIADGSGVSLYNYLTPELEIAFLRYAYHHDNIYPALYEALPIAGTDGTLKNRMRTGPAMGNVRAKTGTLEGVSSLAGYATAPNGHKLAFCIIIQGSEHGRDARDFQDKVCQLLCSVQ